jgi:HlyD family secretion protein
VELTNPDEFVRPGMTAAVNILVREVKDVLLVPNRAVRVVDGQRVVYVLKNGLPEMVKIRLGATSDTFSEVINGDLKVGDLIVLNPPTTFSRPMGGPPGR